MQFMDKDGALKAFRLFGAASEDDKISRTVLRNWVVIMPFKLCFLPSSNHLLKNECVFLVSFRSMHLKTEEH